MADQYNKILTTVNSVTTNYSFTPDLSNVIVKRDSLSFGSSSGELILTPGDTIFATPYLGTVKIEGAVHNPGNFEWVSINKAKDYIAFAGGITAYADKKHIIYIDPYGQASRIKVKSNTAILPGSTIRISELPIINQQINQDRRLDQMSNVVSTLVSLAILTQTLKN